MRDDRISDALHHDLDQENAKPNNCTQPKTDMNTEVITRLKQGDHLAFEQVFHTFYGRIKSFIRVLTKDADMADEVSQEVFVSLWLYRESINPDKNFNAYIYSIARNATIKAMKERQLHDIPVEEYEEMDTALTDDDLIARETALLIKLTVNRMPARRREVYIMSRYQCKSNNEIAQELDISKKVVERHLRLALQDLQEVLGIMLLFFY